MYRILELNPQLQSFAGDIDLRMFLYRATKARILTGDQTLNDFANAHNYYGIHHVPGGWVYREWAPNAYQLYLEGEFNNWNQTSHPLTRLSDGNWEIFLEGDDALWDGCKVKTVVDANLTEEARNTVVIMNRLSWAAFKEAQYANAYGADIFEGLTVLFSDALPAYATANTNAVYAIVGDLAGAQVNYPEGEGVVIKYDELTEAEDDMIKIVGRQYVAHALTACGRFTVVAKPAASTT